jgi:aconitate hydratase
MGVLPLQFKLGDNAASLKINGTESFRIVGVAEGLRPRGDVRVVATETDGATREFTVTVRIDTPEELVAFKHGGILPYVVRQLVGNRRSKGKRSKVRAKVKVLGLGPRPRFLVLGP